MEKLQLSRKSLNYRQLMAHLRTPLYRNGYALILSTGITSALGLLYWAVAAKFYQTENVGLNSAVISIMIFLSGISQINLQETMIRYIPVAGRRTPRMVIYTYLIVLALSALVGTIFYLGIPIWAPTLSFLTQSPVLALWFISAVCIWGIFVLQDSVLTGLRQALWIPAENAAFSIMKILLLVALAAVIPQSGIFVSWTVSVLLIIIPINILLFRRLIPKHVEMQPAEDSAMPLRQISKYVAGNYAAALLANMASTLLPLIITQTEGAEANAHFFIGWTIASALLIMITNMVTSLTVEASLDNANMESYRRRAIIGIMRLILPGAVLMILAAPIILRLVGQGYVADGVPLMQLIALAAIPNVYVSVYISMARTTNRVASIVAVYGANAFLVLGLSHFFLPIYGIAGVGLAWVLSQTAIALTLMAKTRLQSKPAVPVADARSRVRRLKVTQQFDTFICVHQREVGYLLELVLRSYKLNFMPKGRLILITNDLPYLRQFIQRIGFEDQTVLMDDQDCLSKDEMELPGWFRQQLIKLRAYEFCETANFCCLGADTVLLQSINESDLSDNGKPILYYTRHLLPDNHFRYEKARMNYIAELLKVEPLQAKRYVDFISDLFCFNRDYLMSLNTYLTGLYGDNPYVKLLQGIQDKPENRNRFGEWTLYSVYVLDKLKQDVTLRNSADGFLYQAHSNLYLRLFQFNTKVAHFVSKDFDVNYITRQIAKRKLPLAAVI